MVEFYKSIILSALSVPHKEDGNIATPTRYFKNGSNVFGKKWMSTAKNTYEYRRHCC